MIISIKMRKYITLATTLVGIIGLVYLALNTGSVNLNLLTPEQQRAILDLRLSRLLLAAVVGASLSIVGCVYQAVLANPLAEPYILGVSAGGALGAIIALALGVPHYPLSIGCSLLCLFTILSLATRRKNVDRQGVVIVGVMINAFISAAIMAVIVVTQRSQGLLQWLMGDLSAGSWPQIIIATIIFILVFLVYQVLARQIDGLGLGEEHAQYLGIPAQQLSLIVFGLSAVLIAVIVAICGIIGFIGLMVPHAAKLLCGEQLQDHLAGAALLGAVFMLGCDLLARSIIPGVVLPVGALTALIGVPFFIVLYKRLAS